MSKKLYALIISNEDYVDTTLFDDLKKASESFNNVPGIMTHVDGYQESVVVAELDGLGYSFGFGAHGDFYGGNIIKQK
jgi:hypothetical protein